MDQGIFSEVLRPSLVGDAFGNDDCEDVLAAFAVRKFTGCSICEALPFFSENVSDVRPEKFTSVFDTFSQLHRVLRSFGEPQESGAEQEDSKSHEEHRQKLFENIVPPEVVVDFINDGLHATIARGNEWRTILLKPYEPTMMASMFFVRDVEAQAPDLFSEIPKPCVTWVADTLPPKAPVIEDVFLHAFGCGMQSPDGDCKSLANAAPDCLVRGARGQGGCQYCR